VTYWQPSSSSSSDPPSDDDDDDDDAELASFMKSTLKLTTCHAMAEGQSSVQVCVSHAFIWNVSTAVRPEHAG
jgi:hypothetical protein